MNFDVKKIKKKEETIYRSLYITKKLSEKIDKICKENDVSWNSVVISMIESCVNDNLEE